MNAFVKTTILGTAILSLAACATTPPADSLFTGINTNSLNATSPSVTTLSANDPTCQTFYANAVAYQKAASQPSAGGQILSRTALATLGSIASVGVGGLGIGSTVGQVAARTVAASSTQQAGALAIQGLRNNGPARQKIQAAADQLGCPVSFP